MPSTGPTATSRVEPGRGVVCSVDPLATTAGTTVLADGGTAVDAAIATNAVLAVTTQHMCGLGGDLFALVHEGHGPPTALNASGRAGSGADPDRVRAEGHVRLVPPFGDVRAVPVPGCVDGWVALHERYGRLPLDRLLEPAIALADDGFAASFLLAASAPAVAGSAGNADFPAGLAAGDVVRRPGVARVLRALAADGREGVYGGEFGRALLAIGDGEYEPADLATPNADWVEPLEVRAWGHDVWTVPPNSQGYLTLAGAWIAEQAGLGSRHTPDPREPLWPHLLVEAARQAAWDRLDVLHEHADGAALLDPDRLAPRAAAISPTRAGDLPVPAQAGDTIYLCAADGEGMAVSLIESNASGFGSNLVLPGTGIFLQNRGIGFSLVAGHPAEYGPRRRPPHTLAPALVTAPDGSLRATLGTMGGDAQPQIVLQLLARLLLGEEEPGAAIGGPRFVLEAATGWGFETWEGRGRVRVVVEDAGWVAGLAERGHDVRPEASARFNYGHAHLIERRDGVLTGAADTRATPAGAGAA